MLKISPLISAPLLAGVVASALAFANADAAPSASNAAPVVKDIGLRAAYTDFARPQAAADQLPPKAREEIEIGQAGRFGLSRSDSRLLRRADRVSTYLVSNGQSSCFVQVADDRSSRSTACGSAADLNAAPDVGVSRDGTTVAVSGYAPDWLKVVTIAYADGSARTVDVVDNGFTSASTELPTALSFRGLDGTVRSLPLYAPAINGG